MSMKPNPTALVLLLNEGVRAIKVTYEPNDGKMFNEDATPLGVSTYAQPPEKQDVAKTIDPDLSVGDYCVVQTDTRHGLTVARVAAVDVEVDFEQKAPIRWAFSRVNTPACKAILDQEKDLLDKVADAEKRKKKAEIRAALIKGNEAMFEDMNLLEATPPSKPDPVNSDPLPKFPVQFD